MAFLVLRHSLAHMHGDSHHAPLKMHCPHHQPATVPLTCRHTRSKYGQKRRPMGFAGCPNFREPVGERDTDICVPMRLEALPVSGIRTSTVYLFVTTQTRSHFQSHSVGYYGWWYSRLESAGRTRETLAAYAQSICRGIHSTPSCYGLLFDQDLSNLQVSFCVEG